jgi:hypothetical protein
MCFLTCPPVECKEKIFQRCTIRFCGRSNMKNIAFLGQKWPKIIYFPDKY